MIKAGKALEAYCDELSKYGRIVPDAGLQKLFDLGMEFLTSYSDSGAHLVFKHHLFLHLLYRSEVNGNPRKTHTYLDESLNGVVAEIAGSCHVNNLSSLIFKKWALLVKHGTLMESKAPTT